MHGLEGNIRKVYTYSFFYMFLIVVPIVVPYFIELGLSMHNVLLVQAFFGLSLAIFEVPSAYLGDVWGRKHILVLGSFITGFSYTIFFFAQGFWGLLLFEVICGLGASLVSGADLSILYDSIKENRLLKAKALGNFHALRLIGEAIAALVCSALMAYSFRHVLWGQMIVSWVPFFIALSLKEPPIERMESGKHLDNIKEVYNYIFKQDHFLRLIFLNMMCWSLATFCAVWLIQKYWTNQDFAIQNLALFWFVANLTAAIVGRLAPRWEELWGARKLLLVMVILPVLGYFAMGSLGGSVGMSLVLVFYISRGINSVVMREAFNHRVPSKFRNTANSLSSLGLRLSFFALGPLIGFLIDNQSFAVALNFLGILFFAALIGLFIPFYRKLK